MMKFQASVVAVALFFAASLTVQAQSPQYWDINADAGTGGTGSGTPTGTWDTGSTPNWNVNADGTGGTTTWTDGNTAVFSAGGDATGSFTVTVSGAPSAGGITFEEGAVVTLAAGQITLTGTTPTVTLSSGGMEAHLNSVISGTAGLAVAGGGAGSALFLGNAGNNYTGDTTLGVGSIVKSGAANVIPDTSVVVIPQGSLNTGFQLNGFDETVRSVNSTGTGASPTIAIGTNTLTINDQASDTNTYTGLYTTTAGGKIVKNGAGTWILNNFPTGFAGGEFVVNSGTVGIGQNNVFGTTASASKLTINGGTLKRTGATINLAVLNIDIGGSFTYDNNGNSDTQLLGSTANVVTTLKSDPTITVINGSRSGGVLIFAGNIVDDGNIHGFTKAGAGTMILGSLGNAYRGETTIQEGFLRVRKQTNTSAVGAARIGDGNGRVNLSGGQLEYNGSVVTAGDARTITISNPINVTAANSSLGYFSTTATLGTTNTIEMLFTSNQITTPGGDLTIKNDGSCTDNSSSCTFRPNFSGSGFNFSVPVTINNHTTVATRTSQLNSSNATGTQTWSGNISGTGGYRRSGAGATVFSGSNTFSGGTIVDGGTLTVSGTSATFGGGDVTVSGGNAAISAAVANAILDTAKLTLAGGGTIGVADVGFIALAAGINERVGTLVLGASTFTSGTYGAAGSGAANINNEYFLGTGIITVGAAGLPGDFNSDGKVDAGDYATWRKNEVTNAPLANDGGAGTQAARFTLWRANFGNPPGAGSGGGLSNGGSVPEPGTLSLLICAVGASSVASRHKSRRQRG